VTEEVARGWVVGEIVDAGAMVEVAGADPADAGAAEVDGGGCIWDGATATPLGGGARLVGTEPVLSDTDVPFTISVGADRVAFVVEASAGATPFSWAWDPAATQPSAHRAPNMTAKVFRLIHCSP
jgi:hypothetical protein